MVKIINPHQNMNFIYFNFTKYYVTLPRQFIETKQSLLLFCVHVIIIIINKELHIVTKHTVDQSFIPDVEQCVIIYFYHWVSRFTLVPLTKSW